MEPADSPSNPTHPSGLTLRILSSLVMIPVALAAVWFGTPLLPAIVALAAAGMGWEWARLSRVSSPVAVCLIIAAPFLAVCAVAFGHDAVALAIAVVFAACAAAAEARLPSAVWCVVGTLWIALPCLAILWLDRGGAISGRATILWLFAIVWASDIGAYTFGRLIGGPKLAPALSPNKTWAGAGGSLFCVALAGWAIGAAMGMPAGRVVVISLIVAVGAQLGDLAESAAKRWFGVKDSGNLIPGHGGLLDRLDSLLTASVVLALCLAAGGLESLGP